MNDTTHQPLAPAAGKQQGLATLSLVLGIASIPWCLGLLAGIPALITGIVATKRTRVAPDKYAGRGKAITGIVLGCLSLTYPILLPALSGAERKHATIQCQVSLRQLASATIQYADEHGGELPPADRWCDAVQSYVASGDPFHCASGSAGQRSHYAYNAALSGLDTKRVKDPEQVVLFFEIDGGWNASGDRRNMLARPRHRGAHNVAFLDGHSEAVIERRLSRLRWDP